MTEMITNGDHGEKLILAIPSKGRLKEECETIFSKSGYPILSPFGARNYRGRVDGDSDIEIAFLSASEIARELARGKVHLGVTGEDLVKETIANYDALTEQVIALGFGHADVVVAVPESWVDVTSMEDLDDVAAGYRVRYGRRLRIATKYWNLTQRFFAGHGISVYRIVDSLGATEGAPSAGLADAIVDITSTGSTLKANHLKLLDDGVILRSQANLFRSRTAPWNGALLARAREITEALRRTVKGG
ncbi:MAG: ATP phosphoribosyltransferase [Pseudomonadota bacterium]